LGKGVEEFERKDEISKPKNVAIVARESVRSFIGITIDRLKKKRTKKRKVNGSRTDGAGKRGNYIFQ
jgi:hypothetical protein